MTNHINIWRNITNNIYHIDDKNLTIYSKNCVARFPYKSICSNGVKFTQMCNNLAPTMIGTIKETCDSCNKINECWYAFYKYDLTIKVCNSCLGYNYRADKTYNLEFDEKNIYLVNSMEDTMSKIILDGMLFENGYAYHLRRRMIKVDNIPSFKDCKSIYRFVNCNLCDKNEIGYLVCSNHNSNLFKDCYGMTFNIFVSKYVYFMYIYHIDDIKYIKDVCDIIINIIILMLKK
jgi:hypothetical protein